MKKFSVVACVLVIGASAAFAASAFVPFFFDPGGATNAFVGFKNVSGSDDILTITYTQLDASGNPADTSATFALDNNASVAFQPVQVNTPGEGPGSRVPDAQNGNGGSITVSGPGAAGTLIGRYQQAGANGAFAHNLSTD